MSIVVCLVLILCTCIFFGRSLQTFDSSLCFFLESPVCFCARPMPLDTCEACKSKLTGRHSVACTVCDNKYHPNCLPSTSLSTGAAFVCKCCKAKEDRLRQTMPNTDLDIGKLLTSLNAKIDNLHSDIKDVKSRQDSFQKCLDFVSAKIDDFNKKISDMETQVKSIPRLESNLGKVSTSVDCLREEVDQMQQQARLVNIEVNGIPEISGENLKNTVNKILAALSIPQDSYDSCQRVSHMNATNKRPRSIIIKMRNQSMKQDVIAACRRMKGLKLNDIGISGVNEHIFINDHLTPKNKMLFKKAKDHCKPLGSFCWTRDCRILVRHKGKIFHIVNEKMLTTIK